MRPLFVDMPATMDVRIDACVAKYDRLMGEFPCPFDCDYMARSEYQIAYHVEQIHSEGDSPFIVRSEVFEANAKAIAAAMDANISTVDLKVGISILTSYTFEPDTESDTSLGADTFVDGNSNLGCSCGRAFKATEVKRHADLYRVADEVSLKEATRKKPIKAGAGFDAEAQLHCSYGENFSARELTQHVEAHNKEQFCNRQTLTSAYTGNVTTNSAHLHFSTSVSPELRNLKRARSSSIKDTRQIKSKEAWACIFTGPKQVLTVSRVRPLPVAKRNSRQKPGQLGKAELGPHAFEGEMPKWLSEELQANGTPEIQEADGAKNFIYPWNYSKGIIPVIDQLLELDQETAYAYTCDPCVVHISKLKDEGGFCGYRNIQMQWSYVVNSKSFRHDLFGGKIPTISDIQNTIEDAWEDGINDNDRVKTGGIKDTRRYIGTPEAQTMFRYLNMPYDVRARKKAKVSTSWELILEDIESIFEKHCADPSQKVRRTMAPPIYFQHPGHSITVVGIETKKNGAKNLLVFDPFFQDKSNVLAAVGKRIKTISSPGGWLRHYRRSAERLEKHDAYEILILNTQGEHSITTAPGNQQPGDERAGRSVSGGVTRTSEEESQVPACLDCEECAKLRVPT